MRYAVGRKPVPRQSQPPAQSKTFPAPTRGWVTNLNPSMDGPMSARKLDNWVPEVNSVRVRGGTSLHATVHASNAVLSMWVYEGSSDKLFAATEDSIFDITTPADPEVAPSAAVSSQTDGNYSTQMFSNAGGLYQYCCNDADEPQLYDGSTWTQITGASTPAITGVTTTLLSAVWSHASRIWFIERGTMRAWYLAVDTIGGAATSFQLSSVFRRGGTLLFGTTWSVDAGDGLDDKCVFVSTKGEVAVYQGSDPSSSSTWSVVGVYDLGGQPLGKRSFYHVGGEPHFLTDRGVIPISQAIRRDPGTIALGAVSLAIEPNWQDYSGARITSNWSADVWPANHLLLIALPPAAATDDDAILLAHINTNAWARFTGIDCNCLAVMGQGAYVGRSDGKIVALESGGIDYGSVPYTAECVMHWDHLGQPNAYKTMTQARAIFKTGNDIGYKLSASVNYAIALPSAPSSPDDFTAGDVWDTGLWDTAVWDTATTDYYTVTSRWKSIGRSGYAHAVQLQVTSGTTPAPDTELLSIDVLWKPGAMVV